MRRTTEKKLKKGLLCALLGAGILWSAPAVSFAATTAQYEYDMAVDGEEVYLGVVNRTALNVRSGAGTDNPIVKDANGNNVTLGLKDEMAILSRKYDGDDVWYQVSFLREGELIRGYVFGEYVDRTTNIVQPIATPTPIPTPTPTTSLTPTKEPIKPTEPPTATATPAPVEENKNSGSGTLIAIVVIILIAGGAGVLWFFKAGAGRYADNEEEDEDARNVRRNMRGPLSADGTPIRTTRRRNDDDDDDTAGTYRAHRERQDEASILADKERARRMNEEMIRQYRNGEGAEDEEELKKIAASLKEKEILKEEIDGLHIGDMVFHEYFGKGIVRDNSDVNVIEISFGQDVRFLNKSACAKKRLLRKL